MSNKKARSTNLDYYAKCFDEDLMFNSNNLTSILKDIKDQGEEIIEYYEGKTVIHVYKLVEIIEISEEKSLKIKEININN